MQYIVKNLKLKTSRGLFQEECLCLDTINIFTIFTLAEIEATFVHFGEQTEEDLSMCICFIMFRCSVTSASHVRSFHSSPCQTSEADICRAAGWATPNTFTRFYSLHVETVFYVSSKMESAGCVQ